MAPMIGLVKLAVAGKLQNRDRYRIRYERNTENQTKEKYLSRSGRTEGRRGQIQ